VAARGGARELRVRLHRCDATCLRRVTDRYLAALERNDAGAAGLESAARYTENGQLTSPGDGLWKSVTGLGAYRLYLEDPETQQALFVGKLEEGDATALVALRLAVRSERIAEVEAIVARKGSHALFAPENLPVPEPLWSQSVRVAERRSRGDLIAVANTYFDGIEQHDARSVAATPTCRRIENGVQTTQRGGDASAHCAASVNRLLHIRRVGNRRFPVVDAQRGIVAALALFDIPGGSGQAARSLLLCELFKIDASGIEHIEVVMHNLPHGAQPGWPDALDPR
jgi:hypothetical protein